MTQEPVTDGIAPAAPAPLPVGPLGYKDDDLVYVDPKKRIVVGIVEWNKAGNPKPLAMKEMEDVDTSTPLSAGEDDTKEEGTAKPTATATPEKPKADPKEKKVRMRRQRFYPWGTYRSMKRIYKLEGKIPREENQKTLDEVMEKALKEPFWD